MKGDQINENKGWKFSRFFCYKNGMEKSILPSLTYYINFRWNEKK